MRYSFLFVLLFCILQVELYAADTLVCKVDRSSNWAFYGNDKPQARVILVNGRQVQRNFDFKCDIRDTEGNSLYELAQSGVVPPLDSIAVSFTFKTVSPGFYDMTLYNGERFIEDVVIAYEPEKIAYDLAEGEDFRYMAHQVALARRDIRPQYVMLLNRKLSGRERNVYDFTMVSRGDERVNGYISFPKGKKELKGMLTLVEKGHASDNPLADFTAPSDFVELVLYLNARGEGEEVIKNSFTDMLLALDFLSYRNEVDGSSIYVQGRGYAGMCAFVSSALAENVAGAIVSSPDFSHLTGKYSLSSISGNVSAPLLLGMGLQCNISNLQTVFSLYNKVGEKKEYFVDPHATELERNRWKYIKDIFIKRIRE